MITEKITGWFGEEAIEALGDTSTHYEVFLTLERLQERGLDNGDIYRWFVAANPFLDGDTPLEAIAKGTDIVDATEVAK